MKCIHCDDSAIAIFNMSAGCYCFPNVKIQALCPQHIIQAHPLGTMELITDLRADKTEAVPKLHLPSN